MDSSLVYVHTNKNEMYSSRDFKKSLNKKGLKEDNKVINLENETLIKIAKMTIIFILPKHKN